MMQLDSSIANLAKDEAFTIFGKIALGFLALLGSGNLLVAIFNRWSKHRDEREELHEANRGKELDATSIFTERVVKRVEHLEADLEQLRKEQLEQVRVNERLSIENEHLKKENESQEKEIKSLQETVGRLESEIAELKKFHT